MRRWRPGASQLPATPAVVAFNVKEGVVVLLPRTVAVFVGTEFLAFCGGGERGVPPYEPQCRLFDIE